MYDFTEKQGNPVDFMLKALALSDECGNVRTLVAQINRNHATIISTATQDQLETYRVLLSRAEAASEAERIYGSGSQLKLSHPHIRQLIMSGLLDLRQTMGSTVPALNLAS
ncbi:hypothetical protein GR138_02860 [Shinella kummerowiae]|uniref:Uncharacterized protein n=1 Tax=Shinella kummerowiae TaxID=417745 RepID=A0A6N8S5T3_9HYPH|nr:SPOR domain-containing protein [Shinella kummerowiae]MXN44113.1 hypothetical protein [Shinella kummerowiae]